MKRKAWGMLTVLIAVLFIAGAAAETSLSAAENNLPVKITTMSVSNTKKNTINVSYNKVKNATNYRIYYSRNAKSGFKFLLQTANTKVTIKNTKLVQSGKYYIRVAARQKSKTITNKTMAVSMKTKYRGQGLVVAIDAGHQRHGNNQLEPIGPGATTYKPKVSSGTQGCVTNIPEYVTTLTVSKMLEKELKARGYKVIMIRNTHDVNISNSKRAEIAYKKGADILVRVHVNSFTNSSVNGAETICQTSKNPFVKKLYSKSRRLSACLVNEVCKNSGAKNKGIWETDTMSGINWSKIPVSIVEMGFMSNPTEDVKLSKTWYQKKLATGMANGIDKYYKNI